MRSLVLSGLLVGLTVAHLVGQRLPTPFQSLSVDVPRTTRIAAQAAPEPGFFSPLLAAAGLGVVGCGLGAITGYAIDKRGSGAVYGCAAGGGAGFAVGAHLGNRRRGSLPLDLVTSGAIWGAGYALLSHYSDNDDTNGIFLTAVLLPPTQLLATVFVERISGRSRAGRTQVQ
jgi:hypothetical protein